MIKTFKTVAPIYGNIIDEAKGRLELVRLALTPEIERRLGYIAVSDLCALQLRKTFEAIALGCLAAHGELPNTGKLKREVYRADKLLSALQKLHPNFYPTPCEVYQERPGHWNLKELCNCDDWLTKEELRKLYFELDHEMHVGSLKRRSMNATALSRDSLEGIMLKTAKLISAHTISLVDPNVAILCQANAIGNPPRITQLTLQEGVANPD